MLALIQVLAIDEHPHRSESGIERELQGTPSSSDLWITLAKEHPEFFRVTSKGEHLLSLIARHVMPTDLSGAEQDLPYELTYRLLTTAIDLHDRQVKAAEKWTNYVPLWAALIGGIFGTVSVLVTLWFKGYPK